MKIAHIFWSFTLGGAEHLAIDLANWQVSRNNLVYLIIINKHYSLEMLNNLDSRVKVIRLNRANGSRNPVFLLRLNLYLLRIKPTVVHCHNESLSRIIIKMRFKLVLTLHNYSPLNFDYKKYDSIVAISTSVEKEVKALTAVNITRIYNSVDVGKIVSPKISFNKRIKIICVGRLEHKIKGQDILIKAFSKIVQHYGELYLFFVGEGSSRIFLEKLACDLGIAKITTFLSLSREKIIEEMKNYDIAVVPSLKEGFGLTAIEAMICKVPLIVSDAESLIEVTDNGTLAKVHKSGNENSLNEVMDELINEIQRKDIKMLERLARAEKYVRSNYDLQSMGKVYQNFYENITLKTH